MMRLYLNCYHAHRLEVYLRIIRMKYDQIGTNILHNVYNNIQDTSNIVGPIKNFKYKAMFTQPILLPLIIFVGINNITAVYCYTHVLFQC